MARLASIQDLDDKLSELDAYNHTIAIFTGVCLNRSFRQLRECQQAGGDCSAKQAAFISESTSRSSPCVNSTFVSVQEKHPNEYKAVIDCLRANENSFGACAPSVDALVKAASAIVDQ